MNEIASEATRYQVARRVTLVGAVVNLVLAGMKVVLGVIGQSQALIADGVHSLSDLVSDGVVLVASKHGSREPDPEHPYGHGRIETLATVAVGMLLFAVTLGLLYDTATRLFEPDRLLHPGAVALIAAVFSVLSKEALTQYTLAAARRIRSSLLKANAWHHRSDAVSSVVVIIGIGGSMAGLPYLDAVAAIVVAMMIAKIAWDLSWGGIRELIDTGLDDETVERIRQVIMSVEGVSALHMLRSRRMGAEALVDVHIILEDPFVSVSEGHQISETVRVRLVQELEDVEDVTVHIDPEDDERHAPCAHLPLRGEILNQLQEQWRSVPEMEAVRRITLHYLDGKVHVDLLLPETVACNERDRKRLAEAIRAPMEQIDYIGEVQVQFSA
ncbi:MAG: cation diffusion facilitator family transporter [Gammaproteobacteria bacterium]